MNEEILCAGFGGQGIMVMGKLLAHTAMNAGYHVTWMPSYGAEVRGGTAHSMIRIHKAEVASPVVKYPTSCLVMNRPSLIKFSKRVKPGGLLLVDSTKISDDDIKEAASLNNINIKKSPFTEIAARLGEKKAANMIMVGAFNKIKKLFPIENIIDSVSFIFQNKTDIIAVNKKAICEGYSMDLE